MPPYEVQERYCRILQTTLLVTYKRYLLPKSDVGQPIYLQFLRSEIFNSAYDSPSFFLVF